MTDPFDRVGEAFEAASDLGPEEQRVFLKRLGESDADLASEVGTLLAADSQAGDFLEQPIVTYPHFPESPGVVSASSDRIGQVLGGYTLVRLVGTGGMSFVYQGEKQGDGFVLTAAVKVIRADAGSDELGWRFIRERRLLASLRHPHIARLLDGGTTPDGHPYLVMEYVDGLPIDRYCVQNQLSIPERLRLFRDVCDAVACAHRALVVHRDLKPSNILVATDGVPKLLDFGIAKLLSEADDERSAGDVDSGAALAGLSLPETTASGMRLLTPRYASPEQIRGEPTTTATDVYALGVLLYELLTGCSPYEDGTRRDLLERSIVSQQPTKPSRVVQTTGNVNPSRASSSGMGTVKPSRTESDRTGAGGEASPRAWARKLEGDLDHIVLRALEKAPERRYSSVELLASDLDRHLRGLPVRAHPDSFGYRLSKFVRRNSALVGLSILLALVLASFTASTTIQLRRTAAERDRANGEAEIAEQTAAFLENLFRVSDPSESRGQTVTAREILDRGARTARATLGNEPVLQARFLRSLGSVHASLGLYGRADSLLTEAAQLYQEHEKGEEVGLASTLDQRALVAKQQGRIPDAIALASEALALREANLGPNALPTAQSLNNLALLQARANNLAEAAVLFERAVRIRERKLGPNHPDVAGTLQNLGNLYSDQGRFEEAKAAYRRALDARIASGPEDHPAVAAAYSGLASVAIDQGRYADAESLQTRALEIKTKVYGETHDVVAAAWANLAVVRMNAGRLDSAREAALHALALFRQSLGPSHSHCASALFTLAQIEMAMGDDVSALPRAEEAHRIFVATLPPGHPELVEAAVLLADLYRRTGRTEAAEAVETGAR